MSVRADPDVYVPPDDMAVLADFVSGRPGDWQVMSSEPDFGTYTLYLDVGDGHAVTCKVQLDTEPLFDQNHADEAASQGQRFGDGKVVARIPLHLMYGSELKEVGKAMDVGDQRYVAKVLNDPDFKKLRSFRGRI